MKRARRAPVLVLAMAALLAVAACGPRQTMPSGPPPDLLIVIPPGTAAAEMRGDPSFSIPSELRLVVGQSVLIRNDDHAMHYFADAPIAPGQTYRRTFNRPGTSRYSGMLSCSIANKQSLVIDVREPID